MSIAPDLEVATAQAVVQDVRDSPWVSIVATYSALADVAELDCQWFSADGESSLADDSNAFTPFEQLRAAMADEHGAWFSATLIVQRDGSYEFAYNYTEPLEWEEGIDDESYVIDLARHPRPWDEIPQWHPVKRDFTEDSWAAELANGVG